MDNWDSIIKNKAKNAQPYKPTPKWDKMAAMLDQELPVAPIKTATTYSRWLWAAVFLLVGFSAGTLIWWPFHQSNSTIPQSEYTHIIAVQDSCDDEFNHKISIKGDTEAEIYSTEQSIELNNLIQHEVEVEKRITIKKDNSSIGIPRGGQVETANQRLATTKKETPQNISAHSPKDHVSQKNIAINHIENQESKIHLFDANPNLKAIHIFPELNPDRKVSIGKVDINLTKAENGAKKYASITKNAIALAIGPGEKMKWAKHKWGVESQTRFNRLPKQEFTHNYGVVGAEETFSYNPITPGIALNIFRRINPRWELGLKGGLDIIWFPIESTPSNLEDYTEIWGNGVEGSLFAKRHFRAKREKRFRPYWVNSLGFYQMNLGLRRFQNYETLGDIQDNWGEARKKAPESNEPPPGYSDDAITYSYLTGSTGLGMNVRLYRRFSFHYQVEIAGNLLLKEQGNPNIEGFWGFNHQWRHSLGFAMTF